MTSSVVTSLDCPYCQAFAVGAFPLESSGDFPVGSSAVQGWSVVVAAVVAAVAATLHSQKTTMDTK